MTRNENELTRYCFRKRDVTFKFRKCLFTAYNILNSLSGTIFDTKEPADLVSALKDHTRQMILLETIISYDLHIRNSQKFLNILLRSRINQLHK